MKLPATPAERTRANRLRIRIKNGGTLRQGEGVWLNEYEARTQDGDTGQSRAASRKVTYSEEETAAEASGTGAAAETAAGAAMMVREEGKRLDTILNLGMQCLVRSVETYEKMVKQMLSEREQDAKLQRTLLESVRTHYVARAEAEAELIHQEADHQADAQIESEGAEGVFVRALIDRFAPKIDGEHPTGNSQEPRD